MNSTICIYHGPCADGFTAAWVMNKYYKEHNKEAVEFYGSAYSENPPDVTGKNVYLLDFSYKRPILEKMLEACNEMVILDHHKSAMLNLNFKHRKLTTVFDMERSGAGITWDYFYGGNRPKLVNIVEDRDLWKFKYPDTKVLSPYIFSFDYTFENWDNLYQEFSDQMCLFKAISAGEALLRKADKDTKELIELTKRRMTIDGHRVRVANIPPMFTSEAGNIMSEGQPFAACYWDTPKRRVFSLRSKEDGLDVSEIAAKFGGGGHAHAAGFSVQLTDLVDKKLL